MRWGSVTSDPFHVTNGVRQGGILSPFLFNMYMNDLSLILNASGTGCRIGDSLINHLMYADDLVIFSPYSAGLQQLLRVCTQYGDDFDIKYNAKKSKIMIVRSRGDRQSTFPDFYLSGTALSVCSEITYLGHIMSNDLSDDKDIYRQRRSCMHKQTCSAVGLVCALYLLKSHSFERIVRRCILPTCGVVINKAALESLQWPIMIA